MPRSAADATRFTATGPHAHSKTSSSSTSAAPPSGRPSAPSPSTSPSIMKGETPQQKVARLKDAARRAKLDQISPVEKVIVRGRVWADRAHRMVAMGLITATGEFSLPPPTHSGTRAPAVRDSSKASMASIKPPFLCARLTLFRHYQIVLSGVYATFALGDMVLYNRGKRRDFYAAQADLYKRNLAEASEAVGQGTATPSQLKVLEEERAMQKAEADRKNRKGIWGRGKEWLFSGLKKDDEEVTAEPGDLMGSDGLLQSKAAADGQVVTAVRELEEERHRERKEGMLDILGEETARSVSQSVPSIRGGGWKDWLRNKKGGDGEGQR
ncbi:MAG: hypothetical protein M1837_003120 [Sclerophora amabilis]|nr:MAG: hypothetical protein M1837_003120 [Sclerophora amabilis]